jgi:hypothetical protein
LGKFGGIKMDGMDMAFKIDDHTAEVYATIYYVIFL